MVTQSLSHFGVLRMGHTESQILVTHSHLTNFGWSGELSGLALGHFTKCNKEVGQLTNKEIL